MAKKKNGCLTFLVVVLVILVVLSVAVVVLAQFTPDQLGMGNVKINGQTLDELGLGEVKFKEAFFVLKSMVSEPKEEKIAPNAYTAVDKATTDQQIKDNFTLSVGADGTPNYDELFLPILATHLSKQSFTSAQLAYVLDTALAQLYSSTTADVAADISESVQTLKDLSTSVREITMQKSDDVEDGFVMNVVLRVNIEKYVSDVKLPLVKLSNVLYLTVKNNVKVDENGKVVQIAPVSVAINGESERVGKLILDAVLKVAGQDLTADEICNYVTQVFAYVCSNLGHIGESLLDLGESGIEFASDGNTVVVFLP